jgi:hypothetical protein
VLQRSSEPVRRSYKARSGAPEGRSAPTCAFPAFAGGTCERRVMAMSVEEFRRGFRDGTLAFCMPAAHAEFSSEFLDDFSERILKLDWREVLARAHFRVPSLLIAGDSEDDLVAAIQVNYGADVSDLPGLPLWDVLRRCAPGTHS